MQSVVIRFALAVFIMLDPQVVTLIGHVSPSGIGPDGPLFDEASLKELAHIPSVESKLLAIVHDHDAVPDRQFVAAEGLFEAGLNSWQAKLEDRRAIAGVLADALARDRVHNRWGLPGEFTGRFGKQFAPLRAEGDAALRRLLDDNRPLIIEGSEAATLNSKAHYRVADLAAWLLASTHGIPWRNDSDPGVRDAEIARLRDLRLPEVK
jgi:hypothetical protein